MPLLQSCEDLLWQSVVHYNSQLPSFITNYNQNPNLYLNSSFMSTSRFNPNPSLNYNPNINPSFMSTFQFNLNSSTLTLASTTTTTLVYLTLTYFVLYSITTQTLATTDPHPIDVMATWHCPHLSTHALTLANTRTHTHSCYIHITTLPESYLLLLNTAQF